MLYPLSYGGRVRTWAPDGEQDPSSGRGPRCWRRAAGVGRGETARVIVVAGECLVDLIPTPQGLLRPVLGGGPFTVARSVGRLGGDVAYLGTLSTDGYGSRARAALAEAGVRDDWAPAVDLPTTLAAVDLSTADAARYLFYTEGTSAPALSATQADAVLAASPAVLHVGTLGLVLEPAAEALSGLVDRVGPDCLVMVDPNSRPAALTSPGVEARHRDRLTAVLGRADVVKVSVEDLDWLRPGVPPADAAAGLAAEHDALVLLTDGGNGVLVATPAGSVRVAVPRVAVVDTVGAGDCFCGGFLTGWTAASAADPAADLRDLSPDGPVLAAVRYGAAVAAICVTRIGADPPTAAEVAVQGGRLR